MDNGDLSMKARFGPDVYSLMRTLLCVIRWRGSQKCLLLWSGQV